jgi:hypothetical protein
MRIRTAAHIVCVFSIVTLCMLPQRAEAHVLIADTTNKIGAIVHFSPDDEPVAGGISGIYFDVPSNIDIALSNPELEIDSSNGSIRELVPVTINGQTISAAFEFPLRDLYNIDLSFSPPGRTPLQFHYSVRITSSLYGANPSPHVAAWVKVGLLLSVWSLLALIVVAIKQRKEIAKASI